MGAPEEMALSTATAGVAAIAQAGAESADAEETAVRLGAKAEEAGTVTQAEAEEAMAARPSLSCSSAVVLGKRLRHPTATTVATPGFGEMAVAAAMAKTGARAETVATVPVPFLEATEEKAEMAATAPPGKEDWEAMAGSAEIAAREGKEERAAIAAEDFPAAREAMAGMAEAAAAEARGAREAIANRATEAKAARAETVAGTVMADKAVTGATAFPATEEKAEMAAMAAQDILPAEMEEKAATPFLVPAAPGETAARGASRRAPAETGAKEENRLQDPVAPEGKAAMAPAEEVREAKAARAVTVFAPRAAKGEMADREERAIPSRGR